MGKGGHIRTVPIPHWVKDALDQWTSAAGIKDGKVFRAVAGKDKIWGRGITQNVVWYVVKGARNCALAMEENWSRFSSCSATHLCKRPNVTSGASKTWASG